ncbi:MAG: hypothetical protein V1725_03360 [archaeon]
MSNDNMESQLELLSERLSMRLWLRCTSYRTEDERIVKYVAQAKRLYFLREKDKLYIRGRATVTCNGIRRKDVWSRKLTLFPYRNIPYPKTVEIKTGKITFGSIDCTVVEGTRDECAVSEDLQKNMAILALPYVDISRACFESFTPITDYLKELYAEQTELIFRDRPDEPDFRIFSIGCSRKNNHIILFERFP